MSENDVEVIDPPKKKRGRPKGSPDRIRMKIIDAREACIAAGYNPFKRVVEMAMDPELDIILRLRCDFELMKYLQPTYQSVPFLGFDASGAAVAIHMDAFVKQIPKPTNGAGNGSKP